MFLSSKALLSAACLTLLCVSGQAAERLWPDQKAHEVLKEGMWRDQLTAEEQLRLNLHFERYTSLGSHPDMAKSVIGVDYPPLRGLTLDVFHEVIADSPEGAAQALLEAFNIKIISPQHQIHLPATSVLHSSLHKDGVTVHLRTDMVLRGDSYYIAHPSSAMSRSLEAISDLHSRAGSRRGRPTMRLSHMSGFIFNETTIPDMPPLGIPVTINVQYGDVRVDSTFQWAGRPAAIPVNGGEEFLQ